ncbi:hypothetical protein ACHAPA_009090 [Fusarium lateritium]
MHEPEMDEVDVNNLQATEQGLTVGFFANLENHQSLRNLVWGFLIHDSCYNVFSANCTDHGVVNDTQALFDILRSFPFISETIDWGHTYGGCHERLPYSVLVNARLMMVKDNVIKEFKSDPFDIPNLQGLMQPWRPDRKQSRAIVRPDPEEPFGPFLSEHLEHPMQDVHPAEGSRQATTWSMRKTADIDLEHQDPFDKLPEELICQIMSYINSTDVVNLKVSSASCNLVELSGHFWRTRFWPGRDFPYCFEGNEKIKDLKQWQYVWRCVRNMDSTCLANRRRLYLLSDQLRLLMEQRAVPLAGNESEVEASSDLIIHKLGSNWVEAPFVLCDSDTKFTRGSKGLWDRDISIAEGFTSIHVSWANLNDGKYVSGFRIAQGHTREVEVGYIRPNCETEAVWTEKTDESGHDNDDCIVGFELAVNVSGIRGIAIISAFKGVSTWLGHPEGFPRQRLVLDRDWTPVSNIRASFDALKMVSLAIKSDTNSERPLRPASLRDRLLWYPDLPDPNWTLINTKSFNVPQPPLCIPHIVQIFSPDTDKDLAHLRAITVDCSMPQSRNEGTVNYVWAVRFETVGKQGDSHITKIGCEPARLWLSKPPFYLEHTMGERLTKIKTFYRVRDGHLCGIEFHTNWSNSFLTPSDLWSSRPEGKTYGIHKDTNFFSETIEIPPGASLGLFAKPSISGPLTSLGFIAVDAELKFTEVGREEIPVKEMERERRAKEEEDRKEFYTRQTTFLTSVLVNLR